MLIDLSLKDLDFLLAWGNLADAEIPHELQEEELWQRLNSIFLQNQPD